jgi:tetratricopeptide (TPR) repeat protein
MRTTRLALAALAAFLVAGSAFADTQSPIAADETPRSLSGAYLAARSADQAHDIDTALAYFDEATAVDPANPVLLERVVILRLAQGEIAKAAEAAKGLTTVDTENPLGRLTLAAEAIDRNDFAGAQAELAKSARSPLGTLTNGLIRGWLVSKGGIDGAMASINSLSGPPWYEIFKDYHRALIADTAGMEKEALESITRAYQTDGAAIRVVDAYARINARAGNKDEAIRAITAFSGGTPYHPLMKMLLAEIRIGGTVAPLAAGPKDGVAEVLYGLGSAIGLEDGPELPAAYLQLAHFLKPHDDLITLATADIFQSSRNCEKAIAIYKTIPPTSKLRRNSQVQLGNCLETMHRSDEGAAEIKAVVDADPSDIDAVIALGNIYRNRDRFTEAADAYSRGIATITAPTKDDWRIYYLRGMSYERDKRWPQAEADLKQALALNPDQPQVLNYLGYSWVDQGVNLDKALDMIRAAVDLRPEDGYIIDSLGWAYYRLGRYEEAVTQLEKAVELKPADPVINDHFGDALWKAGRKLEAQFQWNHARDLGPEKDALPIILKKIQSGLVDPDAPAPG